VMEPEQFDKLMSSLDVADAAPRLAAAARMAAVVKTRQPMFESARLDDGHTRISPSVPPRSYAKMTVCRGPRLGCTRESLRRSGDWRRAAHRRRCDKTTRRSRSTSTTTSFRVRNRERRLVMKVSTAAKARGERWRTCPPPGPR
jgi:hypothetical protein